MNKLIELSNLFELSIDELVGRTKYEAAAEASPAVCLRAHYEYVSRRTLGGLPLVHINIGRGLYRAKGVIAIGNIATGVISLGGLALGLLSIGGLSIGLLSLGGLALALLLSVGGISLGTVAVGGCAAGILAIGGLALGVYSVGGCAVASHIAFGGFANAHIAIGDITHGAIELPVRSGISPSAIRNAILEAYPDTWAPLVHLFSILTL